MSLTLYVAGGQGHHDLDNRSETDLKSIGNFATVVIKSGTWIFYKNKEFNPSESHETWSKILNPDSDRQDISTVNGSVYLVPQKSEGIFLFAHPFYSGFRKVTIELRI